MYNAEKAIVNVVVGLHALVHKAHQGLVACERHDEFIGQFDAQAYAAIAAGGAVKVLEPRPEAAERGWHRKKCQSPWARRPAVRREGRRMVRTGATAAREGLSPAG